MIPKVHKAGGRTLGLLSYLYGPGKYEEHTDPHLVASFDGMSPDPGRDPDATLKDLQSLLDQPVQALPAHRRPGKHVWHCSVRAAPGDRLLSDEEWADIARRVVSAAGIDPGEGASGCRWAAVRHADDHIHLVATTVKEDGGRPDDYRSGKRAHAACRLLEKELGLTLVNAGDGTAAQRPTSAEKHKAQRRQREITPREELREAVRRAVAGASDEEEFFARLASAGLLIRRRTAPSGDLLGYTVALPGDSNKAGKPVFYSGSKLAPDLSLPRIRERFTSNHNAGSAGEETGGRAAGPRVSRAAAARRGATQAAWSAVLVIDQGDDGAIAAQIAAGGEVLDALAKTSAAHTRRELREAAWAFERASRSHIRAVRGHDRALRQAARDLVHSGPALGRGEDGATTAMVIDMLFFLTIAAANWHSRHHHAQQAAAAHQAAAHLRAAYQQAAGHPMGTLHRRGRQLPQGQERKQAAVVREAVPELAERVLAEPGWHALAATLADAEAAGHDPATFLSKAAARRELDTAESVSDVLVWRLRRAADLPADTTAMPPAGSAGPSRTRASTQVTAQQEGRRRGR